MSWILGLETIDCLFLLSISRLFSKTFLLYYAIIQVENIAKLKGMILSFSKSEQIKVLDSLSFKTIACFCYCLKYNIYMGLGTIDLGHEVEHHFFLGGVPVKIGWFQEP